MPNGVGVDMGPPASNLQIVGSREGGPRYALPDGTRGGQVLLLTEEPDGTTTKLVPRLLVGADQIYFRMVAQLEREHRAPVWWATLLEGPVLLNPIPDEAICPHCHRPMLDAQGEGHAL